MPPAPPTGYGAPIPVATGLEAAHQQILAAQLQSEEVRRDQARRQTQVVQLLLWGVVGYAAWQLFRR